MRNCIKSFVIFPPFVFLGVYVILQLFLLTEENWTTVLFQAFSLVSNQTQKVFFYQEMLFFYENSFPYHSNHIQNNDSNSLSLPIPQHSAQTHDDIHMQIENIVDNITDDVFETDTNVEQNETTTTPPR